MNVIVRPQFYLDIEEEVYWLLANAGVDVSRRWHDAVWQTIAQGASAAWARTKRPQTT
jgi:hypothetical protein